MQVFELYIYTIYFIFIYILLLLLFTFIYIYMFVGYFVSVLTLCRHAYSSVFFGLPL